MPKSNEREDAKKERAQTDRERELRDLISQVEIEKAGGAPPSHESPHDYVDRKMRDELKK